MTTHVRSYKYQDVFVNWSKTSKSESS